MDYEFESIIPWNGEHDTGRDARQKLDRNFAKIKANFQELGDAKFVTTAFFARIFGLDGEDGAQVDVNDMEAVITAVKVKFGLYSEGFVSALDKNPDSGATPGGATTLAALTDVSITATPQDKQVLAWSATLNKWTPIDMEATAGIDEAQLEQILTDKGYATQQWVTGQLAGYVPTSRRIIAGAGLTGGGTLAADRTLALATVGTAGTYVKVTVDQYGRVTGHGSLAASDIPTLSISKISGLQSELNSKLDVNVFEELFEKVYVSGYGYAIRAKLALYTEGWMSAKGQNPDAGGTTGGGIDEEQLADYLTDNGYATQTWVNSQGFLKSVAWGDVSGKPNWLSQTVGNNYSPIFWSAGAPVKCSQAFLVDRNAYKDSSTGTNWNNLLTPGMYFAATEGNLSGETGSPGNYYGYGMLAVLGAGSSSYGGARTQLYFTHGTEAFFRTTYQASSARWQSWCKFLHDRNIGSYALTPSNYTTYTVTKTGGGASGTWGIGITGNAGTATKLQTARTLWGQSFDGTANVSGSMGSVGNISLISNYAYDCGSLGAQWNNVYSRAYHIGQSLGTNYISEGNGDNATYDTFNLKIHAHWGIGIVGSGDVCRMFIDARTGSLSMKGNLTVAGTATFNSQSVHNYGILTSMIKINQYLEIGNGRLYWDSTNNALYVQKSDGTACGFYATGFLSAKGGNPDAGATAGGSGNYVSRDGDTMTGLLTISTSGNQQLYLDGTSQAQVAYRVNGVNRALTGYSNTSGAFVQCGSNWINIPTSGGVYYNNQYEMWHAGNDGSGSGLDADLLDGTHKSGLLTAASSSNATNLSITVGGTTKTISSIYADYLGGTSKANLFSSMSYSSNKLNITIGGTTKSVTIQGGSSGSYLPLSGGTITGNLQVNGKATFNTQSVHNYGILTSNIYTNQSMYIRYGSANTARIYCNWASGMIISVDGANTEFSNTYIATGTSTASAYDLGLSNRRWRTIYSVNALNTSSDLRLKSVLGDIPLTVDAVAAAPSFLYRWKTGKDVSVHAGSAAQYWQQALPAAVLKGEDGFLAMEYDRIALAAVITTARTVVDHETRLKNLEQKIQCLTTPQGSDALPDK